MDIQALIASFATGTYTVTRRNARTLSYGKAVDGSSTTFDIVAAIHPAGGMDLNKVPEARRTSGAVAIFTATALSIGGVGSAYEADRVVANGATWEVSHVETWVDPRSGNTAYRCVAVNAS